MDGSRGAKNTPRPKATPVANRPGARKMPEPPADPKPASPVSDSPKPASRPAAAARGGKPIVDEDDPFGVGSAAAAAQAIPASLKPEKGRLHKVVCPMCEQVGFIPKSAVGKSVRCANEKCMVPVFTAGESSDHPQERRPVRLSDEAEAARKAAQASKPAKRNPFIMYGIIGAILLGLTVALIPLLTKAPNTAGLDRAIPIPDFGPNVEEEAILAQEAADKAKAALDANNPAVEVAILTKRMIGLARQPTLRDKAWARRLTGDIYLRIENPTLAAQEFNQLLVVDRSRSYYRIDPHLARYWRFLASGDTDAAQKSMNEALSELQGLPRAGRLGMEAAIALSSVLINEGKLDQASQLIAARQLDTTIADNRDIIAATAWSFVAFRCRDASVPSPPVMDALLWTNPLHTAVSLDLAIHDRWTESFAWAKSSPDPRAVTDAVVAVIDLAATKKAAADVFAQAEAISVGMDAASSLRIRGAIAAATKDATKLEDCMAAIATLPPATPITLPTASQLVQDDVPDRSGLIYQAIADSEVVRAACVTGKAEHIATSIARMLSDLASIAPPTPLVRSPINEITFNEANFRKQLATELRVNDEATFAPMFRNYRRHLEQLARAAEDRRLVEILLLARITRAGGIPAIQQLIKDSAEVKSDLFIDELSGLLAVSARSAGLAFPEVFAPETSLRQGRAMFGNAALIVPVAAAADQAWANRDQNLTACLKLLEVGAGTDLPGFRQAMACELVESAAITTLDPTTVLNAISQLQNGVWREESYIIAGRVFADRKIDKKADAWIPTVKIPAMEQVSLLYGIALGILERPIPAVETSGDSGKKAPQASTGD